MLRWFMRFVWPRPRPAFKQERHSGPAYPLAPETPDTTPVYELGSLERVGSRRLGFDQYVFWRCRSCRELYPEIRGVPSCNGRRVDSCPYCVAEAERDVEDLFRSKGCTKAEWVDILAEREGVMVSKIDKVGEAVGAIKAYNHCEPISDEGLKAAIGLLFDTSQFLSMLGGRYQLTVADLRSKLDAFESMKLARERDRKGEY